MAGKKVSKEKFRMMDGDPEQKEVAKEASLMRFALPSVFFPGYFLYVMLVVEPTLIYHCLGRTLPYPAFRASLGFFTESMGSFGGPIEYLSALSSHLFYSNWAGALIYTLIGFVLWWSARSILTICRIRHFGFLAYLPTVALVVLGTSYNHQPRIVLSVALGLLFFMGYMKVRSDAPFRTAMLLAASTAALLYLSLSGCMLFWCMVALYELLVERGLANTGIVVVIGVAVSLIATSLFDVDMHPLRWETNRAVFTAATVKPDPFPLAVLQGLYLFFPALLIFCGLLANRKNAAKPRSRKAGRKAFISWLSPAIQVAVLALLSVALLRPAVDFNRKRNLKIRVFARERQWTQLLDYAEQNPFPERMTILSVHDIIIALYHTDALAEKLFDWPVELDCLVLPKDTVDLYGAQLARRSRYVLEMGDLALAEKFAYEALVNYGEQAELMEMLAVINMVKGDIETARVYLNVLKEDLNHADRGQYWLNILARDPELEADERINYLRSLVLETDHAYGLQLVMDYGPLLQQNRQNRAAWEFLMSQLLLTGQLDIFVANLNHYQGLPGGRLPRSYDQALAFYRATGGKAPCRWEPSPQSSDLTRRFLGIARLCNGDKKKLYRSAKQEFGDTYCFYFFIK